MTQIQVTKFEPQTVARQDLGFFKLGSRNENEAEVIERIQKYTHQFNCQVINIEVILTERNTFGGYLVLYVQNN